MIRKQLKAIFRRNYRSQTRAAREFGVTPAAISSWLRGRFDSKILEDQITEFARGLLRSKGSDLVSSYYVRSAKNRH
jgi:predicted transcriptional regulator